MEWCGTFRGDENKHFRSSCLAVAASDSPCRHFKLSTDGRSREGDGTYAIAVGTEKHAQERNIIDNRIMDR